MYVAGPKKAVVVRDTDLLAPEEMRSCAKEVTAAMKEELQIWVDHSCCTRRPRKGARNVLDSRWVARWKWVKRKDDPSQKQRIIRMRITLRGSKDIEAEGLVTHAGTNSRTSQKVVTSAAVWRNWPLTAIDVKQAFLKGFTYEELACTTNEPSREVIFELKAGAVAALRQLPGYEDFAPRLEVLHCTKPGTGCKDAPRCFAIKLARATNEVFNARPTTTDDQLVVRHRQGCLDFIAAKHIDDIKVACSPSVLKEFISSLDKVLGKDELDITPDSLRTVGCGTPHCPMGTSYQTEYLLALKPIVCTELTGVSGTSPAPQWTAQRFLSLLMALAYTLLTRLDLAVNVNALQRCAQNPLVFHIRRLNAVVRWAQRHPLAIVDKKMTPTKWLEVHSDAEFKREDDDADACRLLDWLCGSIKAVTRSTFVSELQAAISAMGSALMLSLTLHEIAKGTVSPRKGMELHDAGGLSVSV